MFFILSKTAAILLLPSNLLILIGLAGLVLLATRRQRAALTMMATSLILLMLAGFLPAGGLLAGKLESRFPPWDVTRGAPDGIVVLGGGLASKLSNEYDEPVLTSDAGRITAIAKLARAYPKARIVYSNGDSSLFATGEMDGKYLLSLLDSFGVAVERIALEPRSRNTFENAVFSKQLAQPKAGERWLLVTSAQHMPRAIGCFREVGFPVEAYPVAWHTQRRGSFMLSNSLGGGLNTLDLAVHEWLGLIVYRLTGKTGVLFPGP